MNTPAKPYVSNDASALPCPPRSRLRSEAQKEWAGIGRWLLASAVFWTAVGLVFALPQLTVTNGWQRPFYTSLAAWWSWGLLTPVIRAIDRHLPFTSRQLSKRLLAHVPLGLLLTIAYVYLSTALSAGFGLVGWTKLIDPLMLVTALQGGFVWGLLVYALIVGVLQVSLYQRHYVSAELHVERLQRSFSEARLNTLRMQLDPHFLFNALNTISSQVVRDATLARDMIEHLGELLRLSLDPRSRYEVRLDEEMTLLDHYLAIQRIRFGDRLKIEVDIPAELGEALVPSLLMQPLVENAIRHGIASRAAGGAISITAWRAGERLEIRVRDNGVGLPEGGLSGNRLGVGLSVTRERVESFRPVGTGQMTIRTRPEGGTEVTLSLPLRHAGPEDDHAAG